MADRGTASAVPGKGKPARDLPLVDKTGKTHDRRTHNSLTGQSRPWQTFRHRSVPACRRSRCQPIASTGWHTRQPATPRRHTRRQLNRVPMKPSGNGCYLRPWAQPRPILWQTAGRLPQMARADLAVIFLVKHNGQQQSHVRRDTSANGYGAPYNRTLNRTLRNTDSSIARACGKNTQATGNTWTSALFCLPL